MTNTLSDNIRAYCLLETKTGGKIWKCFSRFVDRDFLQNHFCAYTVKRTNMHMQQEVMRLSSWLLPAVGCGHLWESGVSWSNICMCVSSGGAELTHSWPCHCLRFLAEARPVFLGKLKWPLTGQCVDILMESRRWPQISETLSSSNTANPRRSVWSTVAK